MKFTGKFQGINTDWNTGQSQIIFTVNEKSALYEAEKIKDCEKLSIEVEEYKKKRSLNANALLWSCLGKIANAMHPPCDKWDVYLDMLKHYGKYTYLIVKPQAVEGVKAMWRECEELGEIDVNGEKGVQMLCYFGSSTYNTKEFSRLLSGVIEEMAQMGLETPTSRDMQIALEQWERMQNA